MQEKFEKKGLDNAKFHSLHNSRDRPRPCISLQQKHNGVKSYFESYLNSWITRFHQIFLNFQLFLIARFLNTMKSAPDLDNPIFCSQFIISKFRFE